MKNTKLNYEQFLKNEILDYSTRQKKNWHRSYDSVENYLASVQKNRKKWKNILTGIESFESKIQYEIQTYSNSKVKIILNSTTEFHSEALFILPNNPNKKKLSLVVCLHGIGGSPEMVIGESDTNPASYHLFGKWLEEAGFAILAPRLVNNFGDRARINRMSLLLGSSIWGFETQITRLFLDFVINEFDIASNKIAIWGHSMGGAYSLYLMPLEERIKVGIISAWFNHRIKKMVVKDDEHYTCFLSTDEEHAFLPGLLTGFSDQDLVSLIVPRPLQIQTGEKDDIAWPEFVEEEMKAAKYHYQQLGLGERLQWHLHSGEHEVDVQSGIRFLKNWL